LTVGFLALGLSSGAGAARASVDFASDVQPILQRACILCHNATLAQGGLSLASRAAALKGGLSGPSIAPGDAAGSLLVKRLSLVPMGLPRMPMGMPPLPDTDVATLRAWIDAGAAWPEEAAAAKPAQAPAAKLAQPVAAAKAAKPTQAPAAAAKPAAGAGKPAVNTGAVPDFLKDIQPILQANCTRCHGPELQRSSLRLDSRSGALRGGLSGPVIVAGQGDASPIVQRLAGRITPRMPFEGPPLSEADIARIKAWIDAGAPGPDDTVAAEKKHWAYVKPVHAEPPAVRNEAWVRNPIDRFILARLEKEGLAPSPEADKGALIRRVSLDLVGLPPSPAEVGAFLADTSPDAYEKVVDRLLASPHYGERWARPWLDLARYADTNGYEKDRRRTAWKYRDWVINALNVDMPFRQFTIEQIAGDMLPAPTVEQQIATGLHRNSLLNQEGGIDVEEARWETLVDRVNTTSAVFLGSTMGCAQCHNHKFDPISQRDYYRMLAFFNNTDYGVQGLGPTVVDKWIVEPELEVPTPEQAVKRDAIDAEIARLKARLDANTPALAAAQASWERERRAKAPAWTVLTPVRAVAGGGTTLTIAADGSVLAAGEKPDKDTYTLSTSTSTGSNTRKSTGTSTSTTTRTRPEPTGITALRLEVLADPPDGQVGRSDGGNFVLTRVALTAKAPGAPARPVPIARGEADFMQSGFPLLGALDDDPATGWAVSPETAKSHVAVFRTREPVTGPVALVVTLEHQSELKQRTLRRFRLSVTASPEPFGGIALPEPIQAILTTPDANRTADAKKQIAGYYRSIAPSLEPDRRRLRAAEKQRVDLGIPTAMVMREKPGFERPSTPLRIRGSYMSPGEQVYAAVPAALPPLPDDAPANRLGLARWLASDDNPLTARVTVNRAWEACFGHGIVETSEDFGRQGEQPTHPELLDWLATEFQRKETRFKALHRLIVTSATYRQASSTAGRPALIEKDPYNRLLARGPRFRLEAETLRDSVLAASGLLSSKVGGPSVFPDQPDGIWDNPYSDDKWTTSPGEDRYRRSLYTFVRRTAPYPMLTTFDAPSREFCTVRRVRTNTPLQALNTLNDPAFFHAARALAARVEREAGPTPEERADYAFLLCLSRPPSAPERAGVLAFHDQQLERLRLDPAAAKAILGAMGPAAGSPAGDDDGPLADRAAWTMVANVILNLDETMTKE
jgi:hypothetical protein